MSNRDKRVLLLTNMGRHFTQLELSGSIDRSTLLGIQVEELKQIVSNLIYWANEIDREALEAK